MIPHRLRQAPTAASPSSRVHRTHEHWTLKAAALTPQFYVLLAAYFSHLFCGVTVVSLSVAHLAVRSVTATTAAAMLSVESLIEIAGRLLGGVIGDRIDSRTNLLVPLSVMGVGMGALSVAASYPLMFLSAAATFLGFGLTALSVTVLAIELFRAGA